MNFQEALDLLNKGEYVTRTAWKAEEKYLCFMPGMQSIWQILTKPAPNAGNWLPFVADLLAQDFELVERAHVHSVAPEILPSEDVAAAA